MRKTIIVTSAVLLGVSAAPPHTGTVDEPGTATNIPADYRPCEGTVPVFNPDGCPAEALAVEKRAPVPSDCGDRIERVRAGLGQPKLDREPASAEKPLLIAAVDKRIDGCPVLQMKNDVNDLRPIPERASKPSLRPVD